MLKNITYSENENKKTTTDNKGEIDMKMNHEPKYKNVEECPWICRDANGNLQVSKQELYKHLKENKVFLVTDRGNLLQYQDGIYKRLSKEECIAIIKDYLPVESRNKRQWEAVYEEFRTDHYDLQEEKLNDDENYIVFNNGVLDIRTLKLQEHSPKFLYTRKIPCNFIENASLDEAPVFYTFLNDLISDSGLSKTFLLQFIGAIMSNVKGWRYKKMLFLIGAGNTGKSTLKEFVTLLIGRENCSSIDLKKLNERFGTSAVYEKRLAGSNDMSFMEVTEMDIVKNLTGGDTIPVEFKGQDMFFYRFDGFLWCNANALPYFRGDRGNHVYERFCILECGNSIPEEKRDVHLIDKMLREKDVIASVAIRMFFKTIAFGYRFTESADMMIARDSYKIENNSLFIFIRDNCRLNVIDVYTKRSKFNKTYEEWCTLNNFRPERMRERGKLLAEEFNIHPMKKNGEYWYPLGLEDDFLEELEARKEDSSSYNTSYSKRRR